MDFLVLCKLFESLEVTSKRLEKILVLRKFIEDNPQQGPLLFDIISGTYQKELDKKTIGISVKTLISVISFVGKTSEREVEKLFNKKGDLGLVSQIVLSKGKQSSLLSKKLTLQSILLAFDKIKNKTGSLSNKIKKEELANLFLIANSELEYKYLARILIDDLRVGVSEGVLKEASINYLFPKIMNYHIICNSCNSLNFISLDSCFKCKSKLDKEEGTKLLSENYAYFTVETPENYIGLDNFIPTRSQKQKIEYLLRQNTSESVIEINNPRELYLTFQNFFEIKYNLTNSFRILFQELEKDLSLVLEREIILHNPIKSMLGPRVNSIDQAFEKTGERSLIDYKYDGLRIQIHNENGRVSLFSRNLENITKQFPEICEYISSNFSDCSFVLDSECLGFNFITREYLPFQVLSKRILSKNISDVSNISVTVKAFDIIYFNGETLIEKTYEDRRNILHTLFKRPIIQKTNLSKEEILNLLNQQ